MQLQLPEPSGPAAINNTRSISTRTHELPPRSLQFESCSTFEFYGLPPPKKQKVFKLWENDELLGMNSTFAMILFANEKYPELKHQYPNWSDRIEVISWYWNQVDSDTSKAYFEKATRNSRENQRRKSSLHSNKIQGITNVFPSSTSQSNVTSKSTENLLIKSENDLYINPADYTFSSEEVKVKQEEIKLEPVEERIKAENDV